MIRGTFGESVFSTVSECVSVYLYKVLVRCKRKDLFDRFTLSDLRLIQKLTLQSDLPITVNQLNRIFSLLHEVSSLKGL